MGRVRGDFGKTAAIAAAAGVGRRAGRVPRQLATGMATGI